VRSDLRQAKSDLRNSREGESAGALQAAERRGGYEREGEIGEEQSVILHGKELFASTEGRNYLKREGRDKRWKEQS
jgi:hypothetical protein